MKSFSERLVEKMKEQGVRQVDLVAATKASKGTVSKWINQNAVPDAKFLFPLAKFLRTTPEWLSEGRVVRAVLQTAPIKKIPVISRVQAGQWREIYSEQFFDEHTEWVYSSFSLPDDSFALRVEGDSMNNPYGSPSIPEGSVVVVVPCPDPDNGKIVVAMLDGSNEATVKKLQKDGPIKHLVPLNPNFSPIEINGNCQVIGYVKQIIQNI
ncbi:MAG: LexA family transcriptional regulator [Oceanisphaera sp.]|uniref:LexA family protein n=1 Tax=Oceanisphaera sp. TaxID=1929979 RepID=UPI003C7506C6